MLVQLYIDCRGCSCPDCFLLIQIHQASYLDKAEEELGQTGKELERSLKEEEVSVQKSKPHSWEQQWHEASSAWGSNHY